VQSSIRIEQLLLTTLLELQESPSMTEDDSKWLQRFALYLIAEFCAVKKVQDSNGTECDLFIHG